MAKIKPHTRVNDILLGPLERPALRWLAAHMPPWVTPDTLTIIGTSGGILVFAGYVLANLNPVFLWLANLGLLINWFGDSLDGTLARFRHIERPKYGFFVDHTVDALNTVLIVMGLAVSPFVRFEIGIIALVGYLLMMVLVYVRTYVDGVFKLSYGKLGPTEVRAILFLANTIMVLFGNPLIRLPFGVIGFYDLLVGIIGVGLNGLFLLTTWQHARELAAEERLDSGSQK